MPDLYDRKSVLVLSMIVSVAMFIGIFIGMFSRNEDHRHNEFYSDEAQGMLNRLLDSVKPSRLREYHEELSKQPHLAAQPRDDQLVKWIKTEWESAGLDRVDLVSYDYLLSWPNRSNPNKVILFDDNGRERFRSRFEEEPLREGDNHSDFVHAFNAYAPQGTARGSLIYVNYGRVEDLQLLEDMGIFVEGKICISRYGKIFRGNRVRNCQDRGAIGVIMFSDPAEVAVNGTDPENVYPNTIFLPGSGVQRGSTFMGNGDPLSPDWPSIENAYRLRKEEADGLPKIPCQPIGYDDAKELLRTMGGSDPPPGWKGKIPGVDYKLGDKELPEYRRWSVQIEVNNYEATKKSPNVIGYLVGRVERDRYVLLGNHRDAWGFGAVDPSSGTAQLMEIVRLLGKFKRNGWRPRRTIVFCSWTAEEYKLMGSYEFVYDKIHALMNRAVGLVNTDTCVSGPIVMPQASPILKDVVVRALKRVEDPMDSSRSYYNFWEEWTNQDSDEHITPEVGLLTSGTDHAPFAFFAGVPSVNLRFKDDWKKHKGVDQYPTYHTGYETFYLYDRLIDPGHKIMRTCAQTSLHMLFELSESSLLPYNLIALAEAMNSGLAAFNETKQLNDNGMTFKHLRNALEGFTVAAKEFDRNAKRIDKDNYLELRMLNDLLMQVERSFLIPGGLPGRPADRHGVFSPAKFNWYGSAVFPGISDLLHGLEGLTETDRVERVEQLKRHASDLMILVHRTTNFLKSKWVL